MIKSLGLYHGFEYSSLAVIYSPFFLVSKSLVLEEGGNVGAIKLLHTQLGVDLDESRTTTGRLLYVHLSTSSRGSIITNAVIVEGGAIHVSSRPLGEHGALNAAGSDCLVTMVPLCLKLTHDHVAETSLAVLAMGKATDWDGHIKILLIDLTKAKR